MADTEIGSHDATDGEEEGLETDSYRLVTDREKYRCTYVYNIENLF